MKHSPGDRFAILSEMPMAGLGAYIRLLAAGCVAVAVLAQTGRAPAGESTPLAPGKAIRNELSGGQSHEYRFVLHAGEYARVSVEQYTINLAIVCVGPDGAELFAADSFGIGEAEDAELIGDVPGSHRLRISASEPQAPRGRYEITLQGVEPAAGRHRMGIAAARAIALGAALSAQGTRESTLKAIGHLETALAHWRAAGDRFEEARTLYTIGLLQIEVGDRRKAAGFASQALPVARASHDRKGEGRALNALAEVDNHFGDKRRAIALYDRALPLTRAAGDRAGEGNLLNNMGVAYSGTGRKREALGLFDQAARIFRELQDRRMVAEEIARLAGPATTLKALDFDASRDTVLRTDLGQYRIVHFATHSLLNSERPELSGVVLSLVDRSGRPRNGFLRLYDIYNLRLGADLVVLSACRTALGGEIKGEGLIGLTRAFLCAGAPRVVATLWEIDDRTTAEAMKRFYERMMGRGERPAAALRAAQEAMWRTRGWESPYYWAAFTLQGEWR